MSKRSILILSVVVGLGAAVVLAVFLRSGSDPAPAPSAIREEGHARMLAALQKVIQRAPGENPYLGTHESRRWKRELAEMSGDRVTRARMRASYSLAVRELYLGNEQGAVDLLSRAYDSIPDVEGGFSVDLANKIKFQLGVAHMRLGETKNCCRANTPRSCILPIEGDGLHSDTSGSRQAIRFFTEVLERESPRSQRRFSTLWLLNIAYMTIGGYPHDVPKEYLIPEETFRSTEPVPPFPNRAKELGLDTFSLAGGAIADDFDNDGYLDLVVSTLDVTGQVRYFHNERNGSFADRTEEAGLEGLYGGLNLVQGDYDNDGHLDFLVLRGGWWMSAGRHPNSLVRNRGDGTFTDVTFAAGLGKAHWPTQTAAWADYDNDGDIDLYVGNETSKSLKAPCQLFRNNGDGTFTDIAKQAGVTNDRYSKGVVWGDYDGDRDPDLYVSNVESPNRLFRNNGDGTFTDVAREKGVEMPKISFPSWFWDFDNDGALDLYVSAYSAGTEHLAAAALGRMTNTELAKLFRGDGKGGFVDVAGETRIRTPNTPMGANFGDIDNDGWLDFFLGTGYPRYSGLMPSVLYRNHRGQHFVDVTMSARLGNVQKGHAVVFADLDNDGDQDIFEQMGGAYPGDKYYDALYENPGFGKNWITVQLVGTKSNRSGIGARIRVDLDEAGVSRSIYKYVDSGGSFGANPLRQSIGLGDAGSIKRLDIFWPTTGKTQVLEGIGVNQWIRVVEGEAGFSVVKLKAFKLGG